MLKFQLYIYQMGISKCKINSTNIAVNDNYKQ